MIILNNITKTYGTLTVLKHLSLTLEKGKRYCLMSPSGSGKTTLLRILMRLEKPDFGSISTASGIPFEELVISPVFQEDRLFEAFSPVENVSISAGRFRKSAQIKEELERLLPKECLTRPVSTLSGGMKRRVAILRALLTPSDILLMDEPFTGLDEEIKQRVIEYIKEKQEGRLLVLTSHQDEDIALLEGTLIRLSF